MANFRSRKPRIAQAAIVMSILTLASATNVWAYRIIKQLEDAYELALDEIRLPQSETGSVSILACEECDTTFLSVTTTTKYQRDGVEMKLNEFIEAVKESRSLDSGARRALIYVFFDIESMRVKRIELD